MNQTVARDAGTVTSWNFVSRLTGFARVVVVGGALGATRLGDTYQASNQVSNILFEFLAAGTLSAVLVPGVVARLAEGSRSRAEAFAGALLARALVVLGATALVGMVFARPIMRALLSGNHGTSRDAQVRLGAFLLLFVLPQLVLYAWGAVVTAVLHSEGRFAAAAAAPVANNLIVIATLGAFWARGGAGLHPATTDRLLLGGGLLGGVLCMTIVPAVAARRAGINVAPRWRSSEAIASSLRDALWASLVVIPEQLFLLGSLVVAGRVDGGVIACQIAFTMFLLPHALLGQPLATVLYPRVTRSWADGDHGVTRDHADRGLRVLLLLTAPAAALLVALAVPATRIIAVGALARSTGPALVAAALAGYAIGLTGYSWFLYLTRISYATGDVRTPGVVALVAGVAGTGALFAAAGRPGTALLYRVGLAHSLMMAAAAAVVLATLARRRVLDLDVRRWAAVAVAAVGGGILARLVGDHVAAGAGRAGALVAVAAGGVVGVAVFAALAWLTGARAADFAGAP